MGKSWEIWINPDSVLCSNTAIQVNIHLCVFLLRFAN